MNITRLKIIIIVVSILLLIPFLAMQFTDEVQWGLHDFLMAGLLLFGAGLLIDLTMRKAKNLNFRILLIFAILLFFLVIWAELAVGILGTPFAGS